MEPSLALGALWLLFAATHIGLATRRVRGALVARLGPVGFALFFSLLAATLFSLLVHTYALHRFDGLPGPALGRFGVLRWLAVGGIGAGLVLMAGSLAEYGRSPMALLSGEVRPPRGLARVTRHPFFFGVALLGGCHALVATRLVGSVLFGVLALFALVGAVHQDGKLLTLRGESYDRYLLETSLLPFAAIAGGRQRLVWRELPFAGLAIGLLFAFGLRAVHDSIFANGGAWVIATALGTAVFATLASWRQARRGLPVGEPLGRVGL